MKDSRRYYVVSVICVLVLSLLPGVTAVALGQDHDQPTIQKDSILVKLHTATTMRNGERREAWGTSWVPGIEFRVNGPITSGSQLYVEFSLPTNKHWLKIDCPTNAVEAGKWWKTGCGHDYDLENNAFEQKNVNVSGLVDFAIHIRNELQGTDATLFTGKIKVIKEQPIPKNPSYWEYVADEDWRIPIGYIFYAPGQTGGRMFHSIFWYRGNPPDIEAHLFYQGKEIDKCSQPGNGASEWEPNKYQWGHSECQYTHIWDNAPDNGGFSIHKNPGDYEIKVLIVNHLARSIKFTVNADGSFNNGVASANKLGHGVVIVPVQVIGNQTANWDKLAWKSGAFYGNPLTGFTAP